jgi:site-specific recombinase XerC
MGNELLIIDRSYTLLPVQIAAAGDQAARRFIEFFTANIRNPNTRTAYLRAVSDFFGWTDRVGLKRLETLEPVHVAAYIEQLGKTHSAPSVKQHLAALRMLFDWLVVGQACRAIQCLSFADRNTSSSKARRRSSHQRRLMSFSRASQPRQWSGFATAPSLAF